MPKFGFLLSPVVGAVVAHAGTHLPGGGDALTTAAPLQGIGGSNAEGAAASFARSNHDHTIRETGGPTDLTVGAIADGEFVRRVGGVLQGAASAVGPVFFARKSLVIGDSPYTVLATEHLFGVQTVGGAITILLQTAAAAGVGRHLIIKDEDGSAVANNITITPNGVEEIDGVNAPLTIGSNYAAVELYSDGAHWFVL
jgi:hypothetical protein